MTDSLTSRQKLILKFIMDHVGDHGFPPTVREICDAFFIRSTNAVNDHLCALERKGRISREATHSRAIRVLGFRWVAVPIVRSAA